MAETKTPAASAQPGANDAAAVAARQVERVRELIHVLVNTIQAARLFPPEHQTVVNFVSDLHARLTSYLEEHGELEIGTEEGSLTFGGQTVHEDPVPARSLPFFFFKDGMKALVFCRGLKKEELGELLATIRQVSSLPAEEGDIVNALWEKDFANIRYVAPDDYLEAKIGQARNIPTWEVDRPAMTTGRIDLSPEDLEDIRSRVRAMEGSHGSDRGARREGPADELRSSASPLREEEEKKEIDSLLTANRGISTDDEYLNLFIEILFLEDRADQYPLLAEQISQYRRRLIARRDFGRAARLLLVLRELSESPEALQCGKASAFREAAGEAAGPAALAELEEALSPAGAEGDGSLLHYLQLVGPHAARLIGGLYERARTPAAREAALEALKRVGAEDLEALISMVQESKPGLARQVVALVSGNQDKRVVPFLAGFLSYKDPSVRLEAVRALGQARGAAAVRVLLGFVADEAESIRIAAWECLGRDDRATMIQLLDQQGGAAALRKRSLAEKRAVMSALGRSRSVEACAWLRQVLGRAPLFSGPKHTELCLCAVEALAGLAPLPEALEALRAGAKHRLRKVREACQAAMSRLPREKIPRA